MVKVGTPSKSFLSSCPVSILFDNERTLFSEARGTELTRVLFCDIRAKYRLVGNMMDE